MNKNRLLSKCILGIATIFILGCGNTKNNSSNLETRWDTSRAKHWYSKYSWLAGANFNPSTAINQLETWQAETFDPETIDRELSWASSIGFNCMRVYLHHLVWEIDKEGFKSRMDQFLSIAYKHGIYTIFVFFDDCWNDEYEAGEQPEPKIGIHNSGWVQDPGKALYDEEGNVDQELADILEEYVKDVLSTFEKDERILAWDLYNEPGNSGYGNRSMFLLKKVFLWAREISPEQPVSAGVWNIKLTYLNKFQIENSDIITYHNYNDAADHQKTIDTLKLLNRPMICTEYMARTRNSRFDNIMPLLKENNIGAINWGLVSGKSNTIYAWNMPIPDGSEPEIWFHDIFRKDGSVYDKNEIELIMKLTGD
ncbi:MAG: cellulase family glycosylhydrolase [Bacteroidales bacterium]|nr:cellulase family glycosylhydrolase [Bacteroidales bacterium]